MPFVFFILFFKQFDAFEKVFSKCFNKFDEWGASFEGGPEKGVSFQN
jgi:hypothetical protein